MSKKTDKIREQIQSSYKNPVGRPKGSRSSKYVTINSILEAIEDALGYPYQIALAELVKWSLDDYVAGEDKETYPKLMMQLSNKVVEQARQMPDETTNELKTLSEDELIEKQRQAVIDYIKTYGNPFQNG